MGKIAVAPLVLKKYVFSIAADSYEAAIDSASFTPTASQITWTGGDGASYSDQTAATWALALNYVQDWVTVNSLSQYLHANEGLSKTVTFRPQDGVGPSFTAQVSITPGSIGGAVNTFATATVTLGSTKPVLVPAA